MKNNGLVLLTALCLFCGTELTSVADQKKISEIPEEVVNLLLQELCSKGCSDEEVALWKGNLKYEAHDLNVDGTSEFFLHIAHSDWCGAGSNCSYWVYQKTGGGYKLLLKDKVLRVKDTVTNGYRDLASEIPWGFCGANIHRLYVALYRFDGKEYRGLKRQDECRPFTPKG